MITPGPWEIVKRDSWVQIRAEEGRTFICELCKPIAENVQDAARAEADARVIVAAPEMYNIIRLVRDALKHDAPVKALSDRGITAESLDVLLQQLEGDEGNGAKTH